MHLEHEILLPNVAQHPQHRADMTADGDLLDVRNICLSVIEISRLWHEAGARRRQPQVSFADQMLG